MDFLSGPTHASIARSKRKPHRMTLAVIAALFVQVAMLVPAASSASGTPARRHPAQSAVSYPLGTTNSSEPSGMGPPDADALPGYQQSYVTDFDGTSVPAGWSVFTGIPGGDPGGHFGATHVVVSDGELQLIAFRDTAWQNRWVTGGVCQCGLARRYGAFFVRSRVTGAGPTEVELLWPANNTWPPEIDFNETGGSAVSTTSSDHFGAANHIIGRAVTINMTLWHTWGVIWTPNEIIYTVDGRVWGEVNDSKDIPSIPMTLDLEQRQECEEHRQCPTAPESMQVDWVAEYSLLHA
jgi:hypothetical protein